ncbi:unnamed protein product [Camellia sinensis]
MLLHSQRHLLFLNKIFPTHLLFFKSKALHLCCFNSQRPTPDSTQRPTPTCCTPNTYLPAARSFAPHLTYAAEPTEKLHSHPRLRVLNASKHTCCTPNTHLPAARSFAPHLTYAAEPTEKLHSHPRLRALNASKHTPGRSTQTLLWSIHCHLHFSTPMAEQPNH